MNEGPHKRNRVSAVAKTKPVEALALARSIRDPWFRCQALSIAALHVPDRRSHNSAFDDAFSAANELGEPNRVVTVSSWPVKAMVLAGHSSGVSCLPGIDRIDSGFAQSLLGRMSPSGSERAARGLQAARNVPVTELLSWPNLDSA